MILSIWTVYRRPRDYPDHFVARRFEINRGGVFTTDNIRVADTLEAVRALLPSGLHCLTRDPSDEPQIVETWL